LLHSGELLFTLFKDTALKSEWERIKANSQLEVLRQATSIATHHDAVTGTEKTRVADDYTTRLDMGNKAVDNLISTVFQALDREADSGQAPNARTAVRLFNPLGWARRDVVRITVSSSNVKVVDGAGRSIPSQLNPVAPFSLDNEKGSFNLFFVATLGPLEVQTFFIDSTQLTGEEGQAHLGVLVPMASSIENDFLKVSLDAQTNRLSEISSKKSGLSAKVDQNFYQYFPATFEEAQASGAYIFAPTSNTGFMAGSQSPNPLHVASRSFPRRYSSVPGVIALPRGQDYPDTFAVSVRFVTTDQVLFNIYRTDAPTGWLQSVQIDYYAFEPNERPSIDGSQHGLVTVGSSSSSVAINAIKFPASFEDVPRVFATAQGGNFDDTFAISIQSVTSQTAVITIKRANGDNGWNQDLKVAWWALGPSAKADATAMELPPVYPTFITGSTTIEASPSQPLVTTTITHPEFWRNPLILITVRGSGNNAWAATVRPIESQSFFHLNLRLIGGAGWSESVSVDWAMVARQPIIETVTPANSTVNTTAFTGPIVQELQQYFTTGYAQTVRLFQGVNDELAGNLIEMVEEIGPIKPITELVTRFTTDLDSKLTCYTDDNALLIQKRTFNASKNGPVPANFFPMVARAFIQDTNRNAQLTLISDRSHGAASLKNGQLQVMLDRRCATDDGRGVGEILDEKIKTQQTLWVTWDNIENSVSLHRKLAIRQQFPILVDTYPSTALHSDTSSLRSNGLNGELPYNVHLLSLHTQDYLNFSQFASHPPSAAATTSRLLVRLQHIFEEGESVKYSTPVNINLDKLLNLQGWKVANITEMNLTGNRAKTDIKKLKWITSGTQQNSSPLHQEEIRGGKKAVVTLYPSEIRTFIFSLTNQ